MEILWFTNWSRNGGCSQTDFRLARSHLIAMYGNTIWHPLSNMPKEFISIPHVVVEILLIPLFIHATYTLITTWWSPNYLAIPFFFPSHFRWQQLSHLPSCLMRWITSMNQPVKTPFICAGPPGFAKPEMLKGDRGQAWKATVGTVDMEILVGRHPRWWYL